MPQLNDNKHRRPESFATIAASDGISTNEKRIQIDRKLFTAKWSRIPDIGNKLAYVLTNGGSAKIIDKSGYRYKWQFLPLSSEQEATTILKMNQLQVIAVDTTTVFG